LAYLNCRRRMHINLKILTVLVLLIPSFGCDGPIGIGNQLVPASLDRAAPFSYTARLGRKWGGDNFEVVEGNMVHFVYLRGIDAPCEGQFGRELAEEKTRILTRGKMVVVNVVLRDGWQREEGFVEIPDEETGQKKDLGLELISSGLAWFDGSEGSHHDAYQAAHKKAKKQKLGVWSQKDPVPPWEFWEQLQQQRSANKE